ncbi:MAG: HDIG domain-containing metalloprotein [Minisyncoccia bacterium]|jgi:putative nucleotidyltransferase with HDIG domain
MNISREDAWKLLTEHVQTESLRRHCLAVEAAMRAYAKKYGEEEELWGICGLIHDFDYEEFPFYKNEHDLNIAEGHPFNGIKILKEKNYPPEIIEAILGHATYSGVPRKTQMAKCLYAVDELCGFVMALAHIRPDKLSGMTTESVERNLKKKGFAAKIDRGEIERGTSELGADRAEHINLVIGALQAISKELGF